MPTITISAAADDDSAIAALAVTFISVLEIESKGISKVKLPSSKKILADETKLTVMAYGLQFHTQENWGAVGMRVNVALFDFDQAKLIAYADAESVFYPKNLGFFSDGKLLAATSATARDSIKIFRIANAAP